MTNVCPHRIDHGSRRGEECAPAGVRAAACAPVGDLVVEGGAFLGDLQLWGGAHDDQKDG